MRAMLAGGRLTLWAALLGALLQRGSGVGPARTLGRRASVLGPSDAFLGESEGAALLQDNMRRTSSRARGLHAGSIEALDVHGDASPGRPTNVGQHPLWIPEMSRLTEFTVVRCTLILLLAGILCSAGGIGGGGIYVTVLMVFGGLTTEDAVPLSKAIVFLGSISSFVLNVRKALTPGVEVLIDYSICRIVVPASLIGTYLGVVLNWILPSWLIVLLLCVILVIMTVMVMRTTVLQYMEEQRAVAEEAGKQLESAIEDGASTASPTDRHQEESTPGPVSASHMSGPAAAIEKASLARKLSSEPHAKATLSYSDVFVGLGMLLVVVISGAFRFHSAACQGAASADAHQVCHHPAFALLGDSMQLWMRESASSGLLQTLAILVPLATCAAVLFACSSNHVSKEGWRPVEVLIYGSASVVTGCLAGLVGIGGGLIFAPFFLLMGVEPAVAVATSSTCVIFTSSSTTMQYLLTDRIIVSLCLAYGLVNLVASYAGTSLVHCLQDMHAARRSFISAIVAVGVLISTVLSVDKLFGEMDMHLHGSTTPGATSLLFSG